MTLKTKDMGNGDNAGKEKIKLENLKQITANIEIVSSEKEAQDCGKQTMPLLWLCSKENETKCNLQAQDTVHNAVFCCSD